MLRFLTLNFRLIPAAFFFALSLMVIIPAPKIPLWYVVILVTEYGHWFVLFPLGILAWEIAIQQRQPNIVTLLLCLAAIGLFLKPLFQARSIARDLPTRLAACWGDRGNHANLPPTPLRYAELWTGVAIPRVEEQTFTFTTKDGSSLKLRSYRDQTPGLRLCILMIHGGGWNSGDEKQLGAWNRLLAGAGYRVVAMSYRLAPQFHWPAQKEDVIAALAYLKGHAADLGIDSNRIILQGRSAGGQIALATAYALHDPSIRGCIAAYAPTDMDYAYVTSGENDILHSRPMIRAFLGGPPQSAPALYRDASAMDLIGSDTPPTLLIHGTRDELVSVQHSQRLRDALMAQGRPVFFLELPWATHGFDVNPSGPGGQLELYAMLWFLDTLLNKS